MNKSYILLIILLFGFALLVGGEFPYLLFLIIISILGYSYYSVIKTKKSLIGLFWSSTTKAEKGDNIEVNYKIYNSGLLPLPYVEVYSQMSHRLSNKEDNNKIFFLKPYDTINIMKNIKCEHRGYYDIGTLKVSIGDIFGIFKKDYKIQDNLKLIVYPKVYELNNFDIFGKEFMGTIQTNQKLIEDYSSIRDIRKYTRGDSFKRVSWKVTAKKNELYVKNYDSSSNAMIKIFMDFQRDKYDDDQDGYIEEKVVECAISIIYYTLYKGVDVDFTTYTEEKVQLYGKDISKFKTFLETMARVRPKNNIQLGNVIINESRNLSPATTIIVITPSLDNNITSSILTLDRTGYNVIVIVVGDFNNKRKLDKGIVLLKKTRIKVYKISLEDNIEHILR